MSARYKMLVGSCRACRVSRVNMYYGILKKTIFSLRVLSVLRMDRSVINVRLFENVTGKNVTSGTDIDEYSTDYPCMYTTQTTRSFYFDCLQVNAVCRVVECTKLARQNVSRVPIDTFSDHVHITYNTYMMAMIIMIHRINPHTKLQTKISLQIILHLSLIHISEPTRPY